ncbi:conserved hypothetical protein [Frankia sp. AiPs1]|uniref:CCE_0567 family metalloprotein n=1 Tax=Frankia sp. AiPa1 TaxID=573492 RepID=UPI00202B41E3|nr:CCE_0567 family metalloprotein [Frankia sp. AiPa1]MCL9759161.1 hypothetical protein [Frankia sp. AiPa1]
MTPETSSGDCGAGAFDPAEAQKRVRKLNSKASQLKLDLHDLSEELPLGWENILDVARRTYDAYAEIARLQSQIDQAAAATEVSA